MFTQCFDEELIKEYISLEKEVTLFFYGDLENYGVNDKTAKYYINQIDGKIDSIILIFRNTLFSFYSQNEDYNVQDVLGFIHDKKVSVFSGKESLIKKLLPYMGGYMMTSTYFAKCSKVNKNVLIKDSEDIVIREITSKEDKIDYVKSELSIAEFSVSFENNNLDFNLHKMEDSILHGSTYLGLFVKGKLASACSITASSSLSGMVVAVFTNKEYRGKGYAMKVVSELCNRAFKNGKEFLCLFYDNPTAGRIYHKIGFSDLDKYAMIRHK